MQAEIVRDGIVEQFAVDFRQYWRRVPDKGLFFGLLGLWLLLFHFFGNSTLGYGSTPSVFDWLSLAYFNPVTDDDAHGILVPFVVLALFWWKRDELLALQTRLWWPALIGLALALAMHIAGYMIQQVRVSVVAMFGGIYCLIGLVWGPKWMINSFFPFFLFAFSVPISTLSIVNDHLTNPLRHLVAQIVEFIARLGISPDLIREGTMLYDAQRSFQYDIAPACSGIRSLVSLLALTTIYGFVTFKPLWKRLIMTASAIPLAVIGNVIRITVTIIVAEVGGQEAGAAIEQKFGFVTFLVAIVLVIGLGRLLGDRWHRPPSTSESA
jgi:exosortase